MSQQFEFPWARGIVRVSFHSTRVWILSQLRMALTLPPIYTPHISERHPCRPNGFTIDPTLFDSTSSIATTHRVDTSIGLARCDFLFVWCLYHQRPCGRLFRLRRSCCASQPRLSFPRHLDQVGRAHCRHRHRLYYQQIHPLLAATIRAKSTEMSQMLLSIPMLDIRQSLGRPCIPFLANFNT